MKKHISWILFFVLLLSLSNIAFAQGELSQYPPLSEEQNDAHLRDSKIQLLSSEPPKIFFDSFAVREDGVYALASLSANSQFKEDKEGVVIYSADGSYLCGFLFKTTGRHIYLYWENEELYVSTSFFKEPFTFNLETKEFCFKDIPENIVDFYEEKSEETIKIVDGKKYEAKDKVSGAGYSKLTVDSLVLHETDSAVYSKEIRKNLGIIVGIILLAGLVAAYFIFQIKKNIRNQRTKN